MKCYPYGGCDVGRALYYFGMTALEATPIGLGGRVFRSLGGTATATQVARTATTPSALRALCFEEGTLILTAEGLKPIEEIKEGDKVLSYNEKTKQVEYKTVLQTMVREAEAGKVLSLKVEGEQEALGVTGEHAFYVRLHGARSNLFTEEEKSSEGEWREAKYLREGDEILRVDGSWARVESVVKQREGARVYNLEVEGNRNYFVGQTGLLAHNNCFQFLKEALKNAKPVAPGRREYLLEDGTKLVFRDKHSHAIRPKYPNPVEHYNIDVLTPSRSPGRYDTVLNLHIVVDRAGNVIDLIYK